MPIFRFDKALNVVQGVKVFYRFEGGVVRDDLPRPEVRREMPEGGKRRSLRPRNEPGNLKSKRRELRRIKDVLRTTEDPAARNEQKKRKKKVREELFQIRMERRNARKRRAKSVPGVGSSASLADGSKSGALPDFIIVGGQKCGTTSLYRLLIKNPYIERGALKEIHYFDNRFDEGIDWYRQQFPAPRKTNGHKTITGEATPAYMFLPHVPERVKGAIPGVRLMALLRNPVNRAYSHYHHQVRMGTENRSFEEAVKEEGVRLRDRQGNTSGFQYDAGSGRRLSSYLARGIYVDQIVRWSTLFGDQLLVLKSEDFFGRREETLKQVLGFLGLPEWTPDKWGIRNKGDYVSMNLTTRRRLENFFEPHNHRLYEHLGVDFGW